MNKFTISGFIICCLWVTSCENHEIDLKTNLSHNIESIVLYPTGVTVDDYNLVQGHVLVSDSNVRKRIIEAISFSEKYRPNHPRTEKAFRILIKIENQNDIDIRASLLTNGKVMLRYGKQTFISDDLGGIVLDYLSSLNESESLP